jgi:transcriptional regulator with GAF, ATPase, and Fis domain
MKLMRVWVHFSDDDALKHEKQIVGALSKSLLVDRSRQIPRGIRRGIVVFSFISNALRDLVREASLSSSERLIAIAAPGITQEPGNDWCLLQDGAADVFRWDDVQDPANTIRERFERWSTIDEIVESLIEQRRLGSTTSTAWRSTLCQIVEIASFTSASVLLLGETGTGKEHIARLIHDLDRRPKKRDLVLVDCTTIVPELSGSEFFGHERGAFTGATNSRDGAFALATEGTLFLDEVGELPLSLQAQLLRAIQEHTYKKVGGNVWHHTQFRLVCATNRDLRREVQNGRFRADLYYRIATWVCRLPCLEERPEDILDLARIFLRDFHPQTRDIAPSVQHFLTTRRYPGNVRELKQLMERTCGRHVGPGPITAGDIPYDDRPCDELSASIWPNSSLERAIQRALRLGIALKTIRHDVEETAIRLAVRAANGNLQQAALQLGITDRALQLRIATRRKTEQAQ